MLFRLLLAAALFIKLCVPSGWMVDADATGFNVRLCSTSALAQVGGLAPNAGDRLGQQTAPADHGSMHHAHAHASMHGQHSAAHEEHKGHTPGQAHDNSADQTCAFAALGFSGTASEVGTIAVPPSGDEAANQPQLSLAASRLAAPPPPSTGPPYRA